MPRTGSWLLVFVGLIVAVIPPILMLVGALVLANSVLSEANPTLVAVLIVMGAIMWAAILGVFFTRVINDDFRSILSLAARGDQAADPAMGAAYRQVATSLDERNRQVASLAQQASLVSIDEEPRRVVGALISAVRSVMGDPTWRCAVLVSDSPDLLPPGVYHAREEERAADPIGDLEQWASVSTGGAPASRIDGPWGAFTVVDVALGDGMSAILYAPWEGRLDPTPAEIDVLRLVGQHARTALDHSMLYAQVHRQAAELNRLASVQADFLRGVTHDLQTPLTSIGALATELRANTQMPEGARVDLDSITHQAERLRRMVSQLLVASRLEAGVLTPQQEVFAVPPLVERTWAALRADRRFEFTNDGPSHLAVADPDRLEQVLWALLDNAVKYSHPGSPVSVHIAPEAGSLVITVRDDGAGMDATTRERAFEQFYRSAQAQTLAPDGSGVGLYAARGLMEAMGGSIDIASELGRGSAVTLRIPAEPAGAYE